jgi:glycosyltransferase involved in cell wall biosynthesis
MRETEQHEAELARAAVNAKTVLLVSPQFPPTTMVGAHRARHLAKHLPAQGWAPIVVTVDERDYVETIDHRLSMLVPPQTKIIKVRTLPAALTRAIGFSDLGLRSYFAIRKVILQQIATTKIDVVFITGFPFYTMLLAGCIRRKGVAVVLDFQDPWVSRWGASQPNFSKAGLVHRLATALEPKAVRHAAGIMSVSEIQNRELHERYPHFDASQFAAVPIGGDWDDFASVERFANGPGTDDPFVVSYVGTFLPRSGNLFREIFAAVAQLRAERPELAARLKFRFVGTGAVTTDTKKVVTPIATEFGVGDLVDETPKRVAYLDALTEMSNAAGQLIVGSDEPHYTASKIYPALMARRPYISLFHRKSSSHDILSRAGGGIALAFNDEAELRSLRPAIVEALARLIEVPDSLGSIDESVLEPFTAPFIARSCADLFNRVLQRGEA